NALLQKAVRLTGDVGVDRLLAPQVVGVVVVLGPRGGAVEVGDVEVGVELGQAVLPAHAGRRRDHADGRPGRQHGAGEHALAEVAVADEVDALDAGRAV